MNPAGFLRRMLITVAGLGLVAPLVAAELVGGFIVKPANPERITAAASAGLSASAGVPLQLVKQLSGQSALFSMTRQLSPIEAEAIAATLSARTDIEYAVPDYVRGPAAVPNDTRFIDQWYLQDLVNEPGSANLPLAWDITTGAPGTVVAVLDSGIRRNHADLGRVLNGYDFVANDPAIPVDFENDADPGRDANPSDPGDAVLANECGPGAPAQDSSWHGTLVTGVIGATTDNALGIAGIDRQAQMLPVRVLGKCGGLDSGIIDGARWAAGISVPGIADNANPARIINMSLGGIGACNQAYQDAFDDVRARGAIIVVAAGNDGVDVANAIPANCAGAFVVAATTRQGAETSYTNVGSGVDLSAPGGEMPTTAAGILSTSDGGTTVPLDDSIYEPIIGTSFAAPVVSGVAALILSLENLTAFQVEATLTGTARAFPSGTNDGFRDCVSSNCGAGLVDAAAAIAAVQSGVIPGVWPAGQKLEVVGDNSERSAVSLWLLAGLLVALAWRYRQIRVG